MGPLRTIPSGRRFVGLGCAEPLRPAAEAETEELGSAAGRARQVRLPAGGGGGGGWRPGVGPLGEETVGEPPAGEGSDGDAPRR